MARFMKPFGVRGEVVVFWSVALLFLSSFVVAVSSVDYVGVDEGDWALYHVETTWRSEIPGDVVPQYYVDINQTQWRLTVEAVLSDDRLRLNITKSLSNGTKVEVYEGSVLTSSSDLKLWVVQKGLQSQQQIFTYGSIVVNFTKSLSFAGALRSTAYASFTQPESESIVSTHSIFWDRETGVVCDWLAQFGRLSVEENKTSVARVRIGMVGTNLWEPQPDFLFSPEFWSVVIAVIIIVVSVGGLFLFLLRRRKSRRHVGRRRVSLDNRHRT